MLEGMGNRTAEALRLPRDVIPGEPVITVTGRQRVYIENYNRILTFREEEIRLQAKTCRVVVRGRRLRIAYYTRDDMLIAGQVASVSMET